MAIKKGDFVSLNYTGKLPTGEIFDLTDEESAKKEKIFSKNQKYGPVTICVGEEQLVKGIDEFLEGKEASKDYEFDIEPEKGFGQRNPKLIQLVPIKKFHEQKLNPFPGARVVVDNIPATVRSISGGRVLVDFNHTLAGKKLHYHIKVEKVITDPKEQASAILEKIIPESLYSLEVKEKTLSIKLKNKKLEPIIKKLETSMLRLIKSIEKIVIE